MKVGNLVRCKFQPSTSRVQHGICLPMPYDIKDELGIYIKHRDECSGVVLFPQFGYEHTLAWISLEIINESR